MTITSHQMLLMAACALGLCAAISDLRRGIIPNRLVLIGALFGLLTHGLLAAQHGGVPEAGRALLASLLGIVACGLLPLGLYAARGLAGGDVKLFMALGALLGPVLGLSAQLYGFACGGLYAFGLLAYQGTLFRTLFGSLRLVLLAPFSRATRKRADTLAARTEGRTSAGQSIRFAPAICAGVLVVAISQWGAP
jgi:prepilin peptidase CpaA